MMTQQVNLFQPIFRQERKLLSFTVLLQACAVVLVVLLLIYAWGWQQTRQMQADLGNLQQRLTQRSTQLADLTARLTAMRTDAGLQQQMQSLEQEVAARQKVVAALQRVREGYTQGVSSYLEGFARQTPQGIWLTGFMVQAGGEGLVIRGNALAPASVPVFIEQLAKESALKGTRFSAMQIQREQPDSGYVGFTVYTGTEVPKFSVVEAARK